MVRSDPFRTARQELVAKGLLVLNPPAVSGILPAVYRRDAAGKLVEVAPATPCPDLLTEEEAIRYLRLDIIDVESPQDTLRRYRKQGLVRGTQVGKCVRYRRSELEAFLARITENNPR